MMVVDSIDSKEPTAVTRKYIDSGIPNELPGEKYILPRGILLNVDEVRLNTDFVQILVPLLPIPYRRYYDIYFHEDSQKSGEHLMYL